MMAGDTFDKAFLKKKRKNLCCGEKRKTKIADSEHLKFIPPTCQSLTERNAFFIFKEKWSKF